MNTNIKTGFVYLIEVLDAKGAVRSSEIVHNLMPTEGVNHMMSATLKGGVQVSTWYLGLYEGNYTPVNTDTAAAFVGSATECTAYDEAARRTLTLGTIAAGTVDNAASRAEFTMNASKTVYGGFISSSSAKSSTSGTLLSAVRFSSPKVLAATEILRVTAGFTVASA